MKLRENSLFGSLTLCWKQYSAKHLGHIDEVLQNCSLRAVPWYLNTGYTKVALKWPWRMLMQSQNARLKFRCAGHRKNKQMLESKPIIHCPWVSRYPCVACASYASVVHTCTKYGACPRERNIQQFGHAFFLRFEIKLLSQKRYILSEASAPHPWASTYPHALIANLVQKAKPVPDRCCNLVQNSQTNCAKLVKCCFQFCLQAIRHSTMEYLT